MNVNEFTLSLDGFELFVREIKASNPCNKTIIFLHDSLGCVTLWRDFPENLVKETSHNAVIYDRRGYGQSTPYSEDEERNINYMETEADILALLIKKLKLKNCSLFGHSDGATIALITATKYPQIINKIIVIGPHIYVEDITRKGVADTFEAYQTSDLKERLEKYHGHRTDKMVNIWAKIWLSDFFQKWSIYDQIADIDCQVLIIQGELDEFGTVNQVYDIQNQVNGESEILLIPDTGHTPHKDNQHLVLRKTISFLSTKID